MNTDGDRILGIDFWRGLALATIFVNHVPGNVFEPFTHKNFGFSDASELFVLLAGVAAALVYLPQFETGGARLRGTVRIWLRAFHLYSVHLLVLLLCAAIVAYASLTLNDPRVLEALKLDTLLNDPAHALIGIATLGLQPAYLDILPLYIALLAAAPLMLMLMGVSRRLALAVSIALYLSTWAFDLRLPTYPAQGSWFFNPLAWQLLFAIGIYAGSTIRRNETIPGSPWLVAAAAVYVAASLVWMQAGFYFDGGNLPRLLWDFDKGNLSLTRLLHILALAYLVSRLPLERWIRSIAAFRPLILMGQHALPVFALGTVLAIAAQMGRIATAGDIFTDAAIIGTGLTLQIALAWALEWNRKGSQRRTGTRLPARAEAAIPS